MAGLGASLMPRTAAARASGAPWYSPLVGIASIMDQASLPGRAYASLGRMEDESYIDALGRTGPRYVVGQGEGDEMADAILRDPLTPVGLGLGSLLKGVRPVVGMALDLGSNAAGMAADQYATTGAVNGGEIGAGAGMGALLGLGGMAKGGKRSMISPEEREANFRNWFGDSKVVDADGNPLVVYHGSKYGIDGEFKPDKGYIGAAFFTDSKENAGKWAQGYTPDENNQFARNEGEFSGNVIDAHISAKKPITDETSLEDVFGDADEAERFREEAPNYDPQPFTASINPDSDLYHLAHAYAQFPTFRKYLKKQGYDAFYFDDLETGGKTITPFDPSQIKSATSNRGTFDPNDPNITHFAGSASAPSRNRATTRLERQAAQVAYDKYGRPREDVAPRQVSAFHGLGSLLSSPSDTYYTRGGR